MKITKIWKSIDFRFNKLLNVTVNTPVKDAEIAPKSYVDSVSKYDTVKANQFPNGTPKFSWLNYSLKDKTFKEIFDDLFFPIILPTYHETGFERMKVTALNEFGNDLFLGRMTKFNIDYVINRGDRQSSVVPKIRITTKAPVTVTEINGTSSSNLDNFDFDINLSNIDKIEFVKTFQGVVEKNDNYGNPYIPLEFTTNYDATYDVLKNIVSNYVLHSPILYRKLIPNENVLDIYNLVLNDSSLSSPVAPILTTFVRDRKLHTTADDNNNFLFAVPIEIFKKAILNIKFVESTNFISDFNIDYNVMDILGNKTIKYFEDTTEYIFFTLDLGYHKIVKEVNITLNKL